MSLKSSIETAPLVSNQKCATAGLLNVMSDAELELVSDASHPLMVNPDMTDPQVALRLQELPQVLGTAEQCAGFIKSLKDTADGHDPKI